MLAVFNVFNKCFHFTGRHTLDLGLSVEKKLWKKIIKCFNNMHGKQSKSMNKKMMILYEIYLHMKLHATPLLKKITCTKLWCWSCLRSCYTRTTLPRKHKNNKLLKNYYMSKTDVGVVEDHNILQLAQSYRKLKSFTSSR